MHIGAPACGMNAAVRSFVRNCIYRGDTVYGIHDGVEGLIAGNVSFFCYGTEIYILYMLSWVVKTENNLIKFSWARICAK